MSLRCGVEVRLAAEAFDPQLYVGCLESDDLDHARRKRDEIARDSNQATEEELAVDANPDYQDWRDTVLVKAQATLAEESGEAEEEPPGKVISFPSRRQWIPYAAAASILAVATFGLVSQNQQISDLQQRLDSGSEDPLAGLPLKWISSVNEVRGGRIEITLPPTANHFLLLVEVAEPYPTYRLEVGEPEAEHHWRSGDLPRFGADEVSAVLPRQWLPAGEYPLRVYGVREGQEELVTEYTLQVEVE